jgi:formylglycine-generating enzyme required for sulfatase activity
MIMIKNALKITGLSVALVTVFVILSAFSRDKVTRGEGDNSYAIVVKCSSDLIEKNLKIAKKASRYHFGFVGRGFYAGSNSSWEEKKYKKKLSFKMVDIPAGTFIMGSKLNDNEIQHQVTLSAFKMSMHEVTFIQYDVFCEATDRSKPSDEGWGRGYQPVINVSWEDATAYCEWLSEETGESYRLPTEAEWEYACKAGTKTPFNTGNNLSSLQSNYNATRPFNGDEMGTYREKAIPVGSFTANALGLYDMHGNVSEWCSDIYGKYSGEDQTNPKVSGSGLRVVRGGSWRDIGASCRSAYRSQTPQFYSFNYLGFRLVLSSN